MSQDMAMPLSNSESKKHDFLKRINVTAVFGNVEKQWKTSALLEGLAWQNVNGIFS